MRKIFWHTCMALLTVLCLCSCKTGGEQELRLWFDRPARLWEESLPLGNGRLGIMPDGGVLKENIVLNDITMWSGSEDVTGNPGALEHLPRIRSLLLEGRNDEAQELMYRHFSCGGTGSNFGKGADAPYGSFQLLGNLVLDYGYADTCGAACLDYERGLSLDRAVAWTRFVRNGVTYRRDYFVSRTEDVIVVRLSADRKGCLDFRAALERPEHAAVSIRDGLLCMEGGLPDGKGGMGNRYRALLKVVTPDGEMRAGTDCIRVKGASRALLLVSAGTALWKPGFAEEAARLLAEACERDGEELEERHVSDWRKMFGRVDLDLGQPADSLPTDVRLARFQHEEDPAFAALYFQYGRYLMLSGTRENTLPLNLQGLWAKTIDTPWNGDYHLNINLQMNYWPMEVTNLTELHAPLTELVTGLVPSGEKTARGFYGAEGWVAHMMTNPWKFTAPGEHASWGATNTGGAWLCSHLWEHYAFTGDREYLREVYPVLKGAAAFFLTSMIREKSHGWLVTAPSSSPENAFYMPGTKKAVNACMGPTMDVQLVKELFTNTVRSAEILDTDRDFALRLKEALSQLPPMQVSPAGGYLQEWLEDYEETDVHHRHVSHLYGLYPSNQISVTATPALAEAARRTLERRGDAGTGWSRAWKICFWARLHDGNRAYRLLKNLLHPVMEGGKVVYRGGGTYPNLFCAHPPFQIDGNFGGCAGIAEMLVQSQEDCIELLPAVPDSWRMGSFRGLCVRGGGVVDAAWEEGRLRRFTLKARVGNTFRFRLPQAGPETKVRAASYSIEDGVISLVMKAGETAEVVL